MLDMLLSLSIGTVSLTREKAEKMVDMLITRGKLSREEAKDTINELIERGEQEREKLKQFFNQEIKNMLQNYDLVTREEFLSLQERLNALELKLKENNSETG